jgi:hypothetical protein
VRRRLALRRETLAELASDDLALVQGAATVATCYSGVTYCDPACAAYRKLTALTPRCTPPTRGEDG